MKTKIYKRKNWNVDTPLHKGLNSLELNIEESSKNLVADLEVVSQSLDYIDSKNIEQDNRISSLETTSNDLVPRVEYLETEVSTIRSDMEGIVSGELNNVYTKAESDSKFVGKTATTVSIEDKSLLFHNTVVNLETGTTSQGKINISEDGLDVKSNHSVSVVVNEDNLGDGYFRVYTGSGRRPLFEVGDRIFRYGENASKIYHEEFKPTKSDVGLDKVENLSKLEITSGLATSTDLTNTTNNLNTLINSKLDKTDTAVNSLKLDGFSKSDIVTESKLGMAVDSLATSSTKGLMSNADKTKLDGISTGANNYVHPGTHPATIIVEDSTHRFMTDTEKSNITNELSRLESAKADKTTSVSAGNGLQGGGTLASNVSVSVKPSNESILSDSTGVKVNIVDNLTSGGVNKALSAEQGKVLKQLLDTLGSGGTQKLLREAELMSTNEFIGTLSAGGTSIMVGTTLFNPKLYLDGTRIDPNQYSVELNTGLITLAEAYSPNYSVTWFVEDTPNNHIAFCFPTMNLLVSDTAMKNKIVVGDVIKILGSSDADDGGHYLVKCSATAGLNAVDIGGGKFLNEIPNTKISEKLDRNSYTDLTIRKNNATLQLIDTGVIQHQQSRIDFMEGGPNPQSVSLRHNTYDATRAPFGLHIEKHPENPQTSNKAYLDVEGQIFAEGGGRVYNTNYKPTATDVNALSKTGGTLSDSLFVSGNSGISTDYIVSLPGNARATYTGQATGAITITLPVDWCNTMMSFWVDVYNYVNNESFSMYVGGYNYTGTGSGGSWYNPSAYQHGGLTKRTVRYGYLNNKCIIYIGETNSVWQYLKVFVRDFHVGHGGTSTSFHKNWNISLSSSFSNITQTITNTLSSYSLDRENGYSINSNILEKQWGKISEENPIVYFPLSFKEECTNIVIEDSFDGGTTDTSSAKIINKTKYGFEITGLIGTKNWIAFGY